MDQFDTDVMDDLMYDNAEGAARPMYADEYDEADGFDELDDSDEGDEFLSRIIGGIGQMLGGAQGADEYDEGDEFETGEEL